MTSIFSRIIAGELPGRRVYEDDHCVALLTIQPIRPGHTLVVPRDEIDHWLDLPPALAAHLMTVSQRVGRAVQRVSGSARVGLVIAGLEVAHTHLHVIPIDDMSDLDFARATDGDPHELDVVAEGLRSALD